MKVLLLLGFGLIATAAQQASAPGAACPEVSALRTLDPAATNLDFVAQRFSPEPGSQRRWQAMIDWARAHARRTAEKSVRDLTDRQFPPAQFSPFNCFGDLACDWLLRVDEAVQSFGTWQELQEALRSVRPTVIATLRAARNPAGASETDFSAQAIARFQVDQALRGSLARPPVQFSRAELAIYRLLVGIAATRTDHENAAWLEAQVAAHGWPLPPFVSPEAEEAAWFMTVHARHSPRFRFAALDAMTGAVERGRMPPASLATRIDHIWSETFGVQSFGTKGDCVGGRFVTGPVQDPAGLSERRRAAGLPTVEEQARIMASACAGDRPD